MNELLIYGDIGFEVQAAQVIADLAPMEGDVLVRVNSYGGDIYEGISIMHALRSHPGQVTVRVEGVAASAASIIAVGGADRTEMTAGSEMMIHLPWISAPGNSDDLRKAADDLERTARSMAELYAEKAGGGSQVWLEMMRAETWFSAQEAVDAGLANAVVDARAGKSPVLAGASRKRFAFAGRSEAPTPKILKEDDNVTLMKQVAERLGVASDGLTEEIVLAALDETLAEQADTNDTPADDDAAAAVGDAYKELNEKLWDTHKESGDEPAGEDTAGDEPQPEATEQEPVPAEDNEEPAKDPDAAEVVTLNKAVYEDLLARAGRVDEHDKAELAHRAAALIDKDGIKAGRLLGWQREAWVERAVENFDATRASLLALSPGTVNVTERGVAGSADDAGKQQEVSQRRGRDAGLAPAPTV